jgi:hypothetical protein
MSSEVKRRGVGMKAKPPVWIPAALLFGRLARVRTPISNAGYTPTKRPPPLAARHFL